METGGVSALQIIFWVLAANAILILAIFGWVTWLRQQTRAAIQKMASQIQAFDQQIGELGRFVESYGNIDQEPFFTPLTELRSEASQVRDRVDQFLAACRIFEEEIQQAGGNRLQRIINAPVTWFHRWRRSRTLSQQGNEIAGQLSEIENRTQQIYELPWELAAECRQARLDVEELSQHAQWLQSKGVRGIALNKVISQVPQLAQDLERVPPVFYEAEKDALLEKEDFRTSIRVFDQLHSVQPAIGRYLPQVKEWRESFEKATETYASLKQTGANLRQAFSSPPPGLLITPLQERLDQVAQMASELNQRLAQPEVENLKPLARQISHLNRVLEDTARQFTQAGEQVTGFNRSMVQLQEGLENLSAQLKAREAFDPYPLAWDESRAVLDDLRSQFARLGPVHEARTPEQIQQQRSTIDHLTAGYKALAGKVPPLLKQHDALVEILNSQPIREGQTWLRQARAVVAGAALYDSKNWSKQDSLASLPDELDELEAMQSRLAPPDPAAPLIESQLGQRLKDTQSLAALHKRLRPRIESVQAKLEKIQALEKEGKERLTGAWNALERVALLAESNQRLDEIISSEIDRLGEEIHALGNELNAHQQGEIEKKAQKIQAQADQVNRALNQWLASLNSALVERVKETSEILIRLDSIAKIDDPQVEEARVLLARDEIATLRGSADPAEASKSIADRLTGRRTRTETRPALDELAALAEIKRQNDLWQTLLAVQTALEKVSKPLFDANQEVVHAHGEAKERLADLAKQLPERRAWPPSNQAPLTEKEALRDPNERRERIKKQPAPAAQVIREFKHLAGEYRLAAEHAKQILDRVVQDQDRIHDLEWQIDDLKKRWQAQVVPDNPIMREGVQSLLSQAESGLSSIKQRYMQGILSYEEVIRSLQLLYDKIFIAQVPVDEQNKVRLNEPHRKTT